MNLGLKRSDLPFFEENNSKFGITIGPAQVERFILKQVNGFQRNEAHAMNPKNGRNTLIF